MITSDEIREVAARVRLQPSVVEKDYALGWVLAGINSHPLLKDNWIFKGGTCLKKCYFETYRFSEDLDFSCPEAPIPSDKELIDIFSDISDWIMATAGFQLPKDGISFEVFKNPRNTVSIQGKLSYRGPLQPNVNLARLPRIKLDLTFDEPVVLPPVIRGVEHLYSDRPTDGIKAKCYSSEELFAEKTRALAQRLRPRDLYDVIHLHRRLDLNPDQNLVKSTLEKKCTTRGIAFPTLAAIQAHDSRALLESEWATQLGHQLPTLPPFGQFLDELSQVLEWISGVEEIIPEPNRAGPPGELETSIVQESIQTLTLPGPGTSYLDKIRFAAANRLRLRLGYDHSFREVEPYSLARSSEGNLLLRTIKSETGQARTYRMDRIESVEVTTTPFTPRYLIEITSAGYLPVHQLTRSAGSTSPRSSKSNNGLTYIFKCPQCSKTFRRKTMDSSLRSHKKPKGGNCNGT